MEILFRIGMVTAQMVNELLTLFASSLSKKNYLGLCNGFKPYIYHELLCLYILKFLLHVCLS